MRKTIFSIAIACGLLVSCEMADPDLVGEFYLDLPETPYQYSGMTSDAIPTLGRVLFYDRQLSMNNTVACASCHKQSLGFADNVALSRGFEGKFTLRNSLSIQNLNPGFFPFPGPGPSPQSIPAGGLFWDGRETDLASLVLRPMADHIEMGITNADALAAKLEQLPYYPALFEAAYGNAQPNKYNIARALQQFLTEIRADRTRLDKVMQGGEQFTDLEIKGSELFITKYDCNSCHAVQFTSGYAFIGGGFANVGLDEEYADDGLARTTKNPADAGKFRIPSLRNVALTAPYMHDGRFNTLEEVIDHYSETIASHPNLDSRLRGTSGAPLRLNISKDEKAAIIAFLNTLTDHEMISDERFADPFKFRVE